MRTAWNTEEKKRQEKTKTDGGGGGFLGNAFLTIENLWKSSTELRPNGVLHTRCCCCCLRRCCWCLPEDILDWLVATFVYTQTHARLAGAERAGQWFRTCLRVWTETSFIVFTLTLTLTSHSVHRAPHSCCCSSFAGTGLSCAQLKTSPV